MMFQLASAKGIATNTNHNLVCDFTHTGTLHTHPNMYEDNILGRIKPVSIESLDTYANSNMDTFRYSNIELPNTNVKLSGYFQSYKFKLPRSFRKLNICTYTIVTLTFNHANCTVWYISITRSPCYSLTYFKC